MKTTLKRVPGAKRAITSPAVSLHVFQRRSSNLFQRKIPNNLSRLFVVQNEDMLIVCTARSRL